ncbi:MAG: 30S ribosomal protein S15 [archaeon]
MARLYSKKKGKSKSTKPSKEANHAWIRYKPKEVELLIVKLAKEGKTTSQIGLHLRDTYGIPDVKFLTKKKLAKILEEKKLLPKLPENMTALLKRVVALQKHILINKSDKVSQRGLILTESKIRRLTRYYKKTGKLPAEWNYDSKNVSLLIE